MLPTLRFAPFAVTPQVQVGGTWPDECRMQANTGYLSSAGRPPTSRPNGNRNCTRTLCPASGEPIFVAFLVGLLSEDLVPPGAMFDAGANHGVESCHFAAAASHRVMHSLDPVKKNVAAIRKRYATAMPNIMPMHAGIGEHPASIPIPAYVEHARPGAAPWFALKGHRVATQSTEAQRAKVAYMADVVPIDQLFAVSFPGERLGLAHIDVEGMDLAAVRGAIKTFTRDMPVVAVECSIHSSRSYTRHLFHIFEALEYDAYLFDEACGCDNCDTRNLLFIPKYLAEAVAKSQAMATAQATAKIHAVDNITVFRHAIIDTSRKAKAQASLRRDIS